MAGEGSGGGKGGGSSDHRDLEEWQSVQIITWDEAGAPPQGVELLANKGQPNGYAGLDGGSRVADANLPTDIPFTDQPNTFTQPQTFPSASIAEAVVTNLTTDLAAKLDTSGTAQTKTGNLTVPVWDKGGAVYNAAAFPGWHGDGVTDDSAAIRLAFTAMKADGTHATGTLYVPAGAYVTSTLDFDGGYANVTNSGNGAASIPAPRFTLMVEGMGSVSGIGTVIKLHGFYYPTFDITLTAGGGSSDLGVDWYNLVGPTLNLSAGSFLGTVLHYDSYASNVLDNTRNVANAEITSLLSQLNGQTLYHRGGGNFGRYVDVIDQSCTNGSYIGFTADFTIGNWLNFSPATQTIGLKLEGVNNFSFGELEFGDRATTVLVQFVGNTADPAGTTFQTNAGTIQRLRTSCRQAVAGTGTVNGIQFLDVNGMNIDNLVTYKALVGVRVTGSNINVKRHQSETSDINAVIFEGDSHNAAPVCDYGLTAHFTYAAPAVLNNTITGGEIWLHGYTDNTCVQTSPSSHYAIESASTGALNVREFRQDSVTSLLGLTNHPGELIGQEAAYPGNALPLLGTVWSSDGAGGMVSLAHGANGQVVGWDGTANLIAVAVNSMNLKPVQAVATTNLTLSGVQNIDGYTASAGDRVLLTGQTTASQNGVWVEASGAWTRPYDFASGASISGVVVLVKFGTVHGGQLWELPASATVDTTAQTAWVALPTTASVNTAVAAITPDEWAPADQGMIAWTADPGLAVVVGTTTLTAGTLYLCKVKVNASATVTNVLLHVLTAAVGNSNSYVALFTSAGALLKQSADISTSLQSVGQKTLALSSTQAVTAGYYYIGFWIGTNGSTSCGFGRASGSSTLNTGLTVGNYRYATADTGLTTTAPSNFATQASATIAFWAALS